MPVKPIEMSKATSAKLKVLSTMAWNTPESPPIVRTIATSNASKKKLIQM
jgi:hypothetical protein